MMEDGPQVEPKDEPDATAAFLDEGLVSVEVGRKFLGISKTSFYAAMERGEIPYVLVGRCRRIPKQALREFLARNLRGGWAK